MKVYRKVRFVNLTSPVCKFYKSFFVKNNCCFVNRLGPCEDLAICDGAALHRGRLCTLGQVMRDLVTEVSIALDAHDVKAIEGAKAGWNDSARSFLSSSCKEKVDDSQKRPKRHRQKTLQWLIGTNNMLEVSTGKNFDHFRLKPEAEGRPPYTEWPVLTVCIDQGGDGWAGGYFLRHKDVVVNVLKDHSHRVWNNSQLALRDASLWPLVQILSIVYGSDQGPWNDSKWFQDGREAVTQYMAVSDSATCPLLSDHFDAILRDLSMSHRAGEPDILQLAWETLPDVFSRKCARVPTSRWFGFFKSSIEFDPVWNRRLLLTNYIMVALGYENTAKPHEILKAKLEKVAPDSDMAKNPTGRDTQDTASLRKSCRNTLHLVSVVLSDCSLQLLTRGVSSGPSPRVNFVWIFVRNKENSHPTQT